MSAVLEQVFGLYNYWVVCALMMIGLYMVIAHDNLMKSLIGLSVFQTSVFILYISLGKIDHGSAPILSSADLAYSHPLPHVLILTAIVVGVATTALGLALIVRIHEAYGSTEEDDILVKDQPHNEEDNA